MGRMKRNVRTKRREERVGEGEQDEEEAVEKGGSGRGGRKQINDTIRIRQTKEEQK